MMDILKFVHSFLPLLNSHSNDFLITDLWTNFIPENIRLDLDSLKHPEIILQQYVEFTENQRPFHSTDINVDLNWRDLVDPVESVVNRNLLPNWDIVSFDLYNFIMACARFASFEMFDDAKDKFTDKNFINIHMNIKKSYEVEKMSSLCQHLCDDYNINDIVDIGSGKGYLGSDLSISKGFNVIELDSKESNSTSASVRRKGVKVQMPSMKKKINVIDNVTIGNCQSIVRTISPTDTISKILVDEGYFINHYLMSGLHCCGGLTSTILTNFVKNEDSKATVIVGCCYHLLNEKFVKNFPKDDFNVSDFPMSLQFQKSGLLLGRNAKTFASQSVKRILNEPQLHPSMFHRVLLQKLLMDKLGFVSDSWIVGKISKKMKNVDDFEEYARISCKKLGFSDLADNMSTSDFKHYEESYSMLRHQFTCFFYLKCCMAAIIENIIIWDRLLFLRENGISNAYVLELFDELYSPRRYALVGVK